MTAGRLLKNRDGHDPWWDLLGDDAQANRRTARFRARLALACAVAANVLVAATWVARVASWHAASLVH